ncbi:hypothetical protein IW145_002308 [Coemansia sp. RSA 521]|nr:hypothetical protein GGH15_002948 [Coemansia sp. RSA 562]KAJ2188089.1 hypothetical protein EV181_002405 [Coemansia sp. RSA 532]KAJ2206189.1 hypothetical protein IW145_002308 [Coemansia sp. RSA 521]KAJ2280187.1 hypothetical protein GGH14_002459 [Coemansia sp. RSA 370]
MSKIHRADVKHRAQRWIVFAGVCVVMFYLLRRAVSGGCEGGSRKHLSLSTKTPYPVPACLSNATVPADLDLIQVQYVLRHGARYEVESGIEYIQRIYTELGDRVPHAWLKPDMVNKTKAAELSTSGYTTSAKLGQRLHQRYPELWSRLESNAQTIQFVSSEFQRTIATANAFRSAADPQNQTLPVKVIPLDSDSILAMKLTCPRWAAAKTTVQTQVANEISTFDAIYGAELQAHVSKGLLKHSAHELTPEQIQTMYRLCGYDVSLYNEHSHWCTLFDERTSALLELRSDIRYSRVYGPYGALINQHIACSLFSTIVKDIDQALRNPSTASSMFRFGHAETLMFVSNLLGLDQALGLTAPPITGNMTFEQSLHRGFRTTALVPFSSNLGIELYVDQTSQAFFRLLLNERVVRLPGCTSDVCPLGVLRSKLADDVGCAYADICQV